MTGEHCGVPTRDGQPCTATGLPQFDGRCVGHQEQAAEARARGGRNSSLQVRRRKALQTNQLRENDTLLLSLMKDACNAPQGTLPRLQLLLSAIAERRRGFELALRAQELQRRNLAK